jgi:hypothetical protein
MKTSLETKQAHEIPPYRVIRAKCLPATGERGYRVKIWEVPPFNDMREIYKTVPYCHTTDSVQQQALDILIRNGFNIVGRSSDKTCYMFFVNNWSDEFVGVSDIK